MTSKEIRASFLKFFEKNGHRIVPSSPLVLHELHAKGIARDVAAAAVANVFGDLDERTLVDRAIQKKLRHRPQPVSPAEHARLYQHLMRQGFSPGAVTDALRKLRKG